MSGRSIVHGGVFGWTRSWELGWDGHCNRMLEVADGASFYAWESILGALYIGRKYEDSTLRVRIRIGARRVWRNNTMKSDWRGHTIYRDNIYLLYLLSLITYN